jgi:restriction system protein
MAQRDQTRAHMSQSVRPHLLGWSILLPFSLLLYAVPRPLIDPAWAGGASLRDLAATVLHRLAAAPERSAILLLCSALLLGATLSLAHRLRLHLLHRRALADPTGKALREMAWKDFEPLARRVFRRQGYRVFPARALPASGRPAESVDLVLTKDGERYLVHCGQWRDWQVGAEAVQQLHALIPQETAAGAFVVTGGEFTHAAERFAQGKLVQLVDIYRLREMACGKHTPGYRLMPESCRRLPLRRVATAALVVGALAAMGGAVTRWRTQDPAAAPGAAALSAEDLAGGSRITGDPAYRARTPVLPAAIRVDFPALGELHSTHKRSSPAPTPADTEHGYTDGSPSAPASLQSRAEALEADFEAQYQPPADCENWKSTEHMVSCGNHRIRAWKAYRAEHWSGGRINTASTGIGASRLP